MKLRVHSIFESISGEAGFFPQGSWCTFIRLQGCNLRCSWCDTKESQTSGGGKDLTIDEIVNQCRTEKIVITGGEPLLQKEALLSLIGDLSRFHDVQIETNGSFPIPRWTYSDSDSDIRIRCSWVVDYKPPSSCNESKILNAAFERTEIPNLISNRVMIKFVIKTTEDYRSAMSCAFWLRSQGYYQEFILSMPPTAEDMRLIIDLIKQSDDAKSLLNDIIFSVQLHKLIGMD